MEDEDSDKEEEEVNLDAESHIALDELKNQRRKNQILMSFSRIMRKKTITRLMNLIRYSKRWKLRLCL